jgi:ATP-dependent 26S proteasome regulatory subunit
VPDAAATQAILVRYFKARIPFIALRTSERARALELIERAGNEIHLPVLVHTLSAGLIDRTTGRKVSEDRSVMAVLDFAAEQMKVRQNLTLVLTEVADIEDDTAMARQLADVVLLASERGGSIVVPTMKSIWPTLQRLGMSVTLDVPTEDEMVEIIRATIEPYRGQMRVEWGDAEYKQAGSILAGISRIEAENVDATLLAKGSIGKDDTEELIKAKDRIFSDISGIERIEVKDLSVGGLEGLQAWLERERPLFTADLRDRKLRPPRGALLVGVPGCGKSLSAKAIAASWKLPLFRLDLANIHGQYLGQSEGRLKAALSTADHVAPCVLWIDEIEKGLAGAGDQGTSTRLVGHFLFWLQESTSRVFVVATANDVSQLPAELLRRGRFDEIFFVDLPTPQERREIISLYVRRNLRDPIDDALLEQLVGLSDGFAGSDLEAGVREVAKDAFLKGDDAVVPELFLRSFRNVVPLTKTNPERIEQIRAWGRDRAVPASGVAAGAPGAEDHPTRRVVLT